MNLNVPEDLQEHLLITNKKGFYALYNCKDDILYTVDYFDGRKFKCWLQMHLSGPEVGWKAYEKPEFATPLAWNTCIRFSDTFFFYLGE